MICILEESCRAFIIPHMFALFPQKKTSTMRSPLTNTKNRKSSSNGVKDEPSPSKLPATREGLAKPLSSIELKYLDYLQRELNVQLNGCSIGYFTRRHGIGGGDGTDASSRYYRGCVATEDIKAGKVVVSVPDDSVLLAESTCACASAVVELNLRDCQKVVKEASSCGHRGITMEEEEDEEEDEGMDNGEPRLQREALIVAITCELALGIKSRYYPYLATMPRVKKFSDCLLAWTEAQKERLRGTDCWARFKSYADEESKEVPSLTQLHFEKVARPFFEAVANGKGKAPKALREAIEQLLKNEKKNKERDVNVEMMALSNDMDDDYGSLTDNINNTDKKRRLMKNNSVNKNSEDDSDEDISSSKPAANSAEASQSQSLARLYRDAVNIVASYSFTLGEDETETQALVPFWDMLNHTHPALASVKLSHDASTNRLNMIAVRDIRKGDEIFNTYGPLSDGELLRRYGFLPNSSRNPHNSVTISFKELFAACDKVYGFENPRLVQKKVLELTNETSSSRFEVFPNGRPSRKLIAIADAIFSVEEDDEEEEEEEDEEFELEKKDIRAKEITEALNLVAIRALTPGKRYPTARREAYKSIQTLLDHASRAKRSDVNFRENCIDRRRVVMALRVRLSELKTFSMCRKWLSMGKVRKWLL